MLGEYFGVDAGQIGITRNTSESNNIIVNGLDFSPGDEVIVWEQNHPTNLIAWKHRAKRLGFTVRTISVPALPSTKADLLKPFSEAITARTKLIAFSHISNVSGLALPAREICQLARSKGILTLVDGAQSFGFMDLDLGQLGCSFYSGSAHKWLMGPIENGILYVDKEYMEKIWPNIIGAGWKEGQDSLDQKVCILGQRNNPSTAAMIDILDFHFAIGKKNIEERIRQLNSYLKERIAERIPAASFVTPEQAEFSGGITIVQLPGKDPMLVFSKLYEDHGIACAPTGGIRISPNIYCTLKDIDRIVSAIEQLS